MKRSNVFLNKRVTFKLVLILLFLNQGSSAQVSFFHSLGVSYHGFEKRQFPVFNYSCRLNCLDIKDDVTLSIGTHLGFWGIQNANSNSYILDTPLLAELNFGRGAKKNCVKVLGGSIGVGLGINNNGYYYRDGFTQYEVAEYNHAVGIQSLASIRYKGYGLRVSYLFNLEKIYYDIFAVTIFASLTN
jgi:hypothetical protein